MKKQGAKPKIEETKEMIERIEHLASRGLNMEQIAACLTVSQATLYKAKAELPEISEAIKRGRASGVREVTNALFEKATGGDTIAAIFYLKNRAPDDWKDRKEVNQNISGSLSTGKQPTKEDKDLVRQVRALKEQQERVTH